MLQETNPYKSNGYRGMEDIKASETWTVGMDSIALMPHEIKFEIKFVNSDKHSKNSKKNMEWY